jgi:hypothetical protein
MASILKVDKLDPQSGTALEIGTSGDTISVPSGATLDISSATLTPPATLPASSGVNLTALNATNLGSGTVPTARLGTGTASSSTVLYGDQTYKAEPGGGKILQVVQTTATSASTHSTVSTYTASNVSGAITPTAASSKIFVSFFWLGTTSNEPAQLSGGAAKIYQDIDSGGYAALYPSSVGGMQFRITREVGSGGLSIRAYQNITYLDSPSYTLTDVITYKLYAAAGSSGWGNYYVCPDGDSASVILMEVAA